MLGDKIIQKIRLFLNILLIAFFTIDLAYATILHVDLDIDNCTNQYSVQNCYTSIQAAINEAEPGDTIRVSTGFYNESVIINKSVDMLGEGWENTIIEAGLYPWVFDIRSDNVKISGFKITGSSHTAINIERVNSCTISDNKVSSTGAAIYLRLSNSNKIINNSVIGEIDIYLQNSNSNVIKGNTIKGSHLGKEGSGIKLVDSNNNMILNNTAFVRRSGVTIYGSSKNIILNNNFSNNFASGISIEFNCKNNQIRNNILKENLVDLAINAISEEYCNNLIEDNTGSGNNQIKYCNHSVNLQNEMLSELILCNADKSMIDNITIKGSENNNNGIFVLWTDNSSIYNVDIYNNGAGISFYHSAENRVANVHVFSNYKGMSLFNSDENIIEKSDFLYNIKDGISLRNSNGNEFISNNVSFNLINGISMYNSSYNFIIENNITQNNKTGLSLEDSFNNFIFFNYFKNKLNVNMSGSYQNQWNSSGGGNFWANIRATGYSETCDDEDNDKICDSKYEIERGNIDYFPVKIYGDIQYNKINKRLFLNILIVFVFIGLVYQYFIKK